MAKKKVKFNEILLYFLTTIAGLVFTWSLIAWIEQIGFDAKILTIISGLCIMLLIIFGYYKTK